MNSEAVLAVLPNSKAYALSMNEIALAMGLDISSYTAMSRTKRQLSRTLRTLMKRGYVACDVRQGENGHKAWHNAYWKTELVKSV
jgi:predicted GNAT superfamily acetyltransferase